MVVNDQTSHVRHDRFAEFIECFDANSKTPKSGDSSCFIRPTCSPSREDKYWSLPPQAGFAAATPTARAKITFAEAWSLSRTSPQTHW
jgi:hypothetical protein